MKQKLLLWVLSFILLTDAFARSSHKTTFMIVPDHGRGVGEKWTTHGRYIPHADETWFMAMGPDTELLGEIKTEMQIYQTQFSRTIAGLLGFDYFIPGREEVLNHSNH